MAIQKKLSAFFCLKAVFLAGAVTSSATSNANDFESRVCRLLSKNGAFLGQVYTTALGDPNVEPRIEFPLGNSVSAYDTKIQQETDQSTKTIRRHIEAKAVGGNKYEVAVKEKLLKFSRASNTPYASEDSRSIYSAKLEGGFCQGMIQDYPNGLQSAVLKILVDTKEIPKN